MQQTRYSNDDGVAYVFFMIIALLLLGGLVWMGVTMAFNQMMIPVNERIDAGLVSTQTADPIMFGMGILSAVPIFLLIGALMWAVLAAVNKR
jgi:hypothetical protein